MVSTVRSASRTSTTCDLWFQSFESPPATYRPQKACAVSSGAQSAGSASSSRSDHCFITDLPDENPGSGRGPLERAAREDAVENRDGERGGGERPQQAVRAVEPELHDTGAERDEAREHDPSGARVRRRPGIADHVERVERERSVLELVERRH